MRFFADPEPVVLGRNEEAYVEVQVGWLAATGRNPVRLGALCAGEEDTGPPAGTGPPGGSCAL